MSVTAAHSLALAERAPRSLAPRARWSPLEVAFWLAALRDHLSAAEQAPDPDRDRDPRACSRSRSTSSSAMPASCRSATPPSSASAPMWREFSPSTGSSRSRCWRCWRPALAAAVLGFVTSFLVLRGSDLTRLMVTLGVALVLREIANRLDDHRRRRRPAGRRDGAGARPLRVRYLRQDRLRLQPGRAVRAVPDRAPHRATRRSGCRCARCKGNPLRASAIGIHVNAPARRGLHHRGRLCRASPARC